MPMGMTSIDENELADLKKAKEERDELLEQLKMVRAALETVAPKPPAEFADVLGSYSTLIIDKGCREPVGWGFRITRKLEDEEAERMKAHGTIDWIGHEEYGLIVRYLSAEEAVAKYGPQGDVTFGPRGGFQQVMYGTKAFNHRKMKP